MAIDELHLVATRHDLLQHSFYQRWTRGELTLDELQDYACQYYQVTRAMPVWLEAMAAAGDEGLRGHAREEAEHVEMWAAFAGALGVDREALDGSKPNNATQRLLDAGDALVAEGLGTAAVWALEAQTPAVSVEKLRGLREHYGITGDGARYFEVHRTMDVRHSAELEAAIEPGTVPVAAAERMTLALWDLLTSVERAPAAC